MQMTLLRRLDSLRAMRIEENRSGVAAEGITPSGAQCAERLLDGHAVEFRRREGVVYAHCPALGMFTTAATADAALTALEAHLAERRTFEAGSGLTLPTADPAPAGRTTGRDLKRWAVTLLATGVIAFQLGYAVSAGISRGIGHAFRTEVRDSLVVSAERQIIALADSRNDLGAEQQRKLIEIVRALKARYGPVWDELTAGRASETGGANEQRR